MDPYKILEVSPNATPEEIHASYLRLVKKYHPDRYPDGPQKDFATEKIKQINAAYDMLSDKKSASSASSYSGTNAGSGAPSDAAVFSRVRDLIRSGQLTAAAHLLDAMNTRSAQWYYLRGVIYRKSGYYDHAKQCYGIGRVLGTDECGIPSRLRISRPIGRAVCFRPGRKCGRVRFLHALLDLHVYEHVLARMPLILRAAALMCVFLSEIEAKPLTFVKNRTLLFLLYAQFVKIGYVFI